MNFRYTLLLLVLITSSACSSLREKKEEPYVQLTKKRCFGKCAVYDVFIYKNGWVKYNGIDHVEKKGIYEFKLTEQMMRELDQELLKIDFDQLEGKKKFKRDMQITMLVFNTRSISFQGKTPKVLEKLMNKIDNIISFM